MSRLTIIITGTIAVIAAHSGHIHLIEHSADNICLHTGRMAQRVLHGIDFRGAPLNHENIGIYEARRRADVHTSNKRRKINNHIIVFALEFVKKRFCRVRSKHLSRAWRTTQHLPAKMPYWWLDHSRSRLQVQPFQQRHREIRRSASGASARESEGWRRSQSNKMTRAPPCAMSAAIAAARVDLPSLGKHDVKPMTLVSYLLFRSTVNFIDRMASAYGDDGELMISPHACLERSKWSSAPIDQPTALSLLAAQQAVADQKKFSSPVIG